MKKFVLLFPIIAGYLTGAAQASTKYGAVDRAVEKLGALPELNVARIADTITAAFSDNEDKARAIFYWIANNIAIDPKGSRQNDSKNTLPEQVIELRKTTALGFSLLVQEMCSDENIRCISVDGYRKNNPDDINETNTEINYSWNVIQLGQSPETWYFADACSASGSLDKKMTAFTKNFTSEYFFADRTAFNLANYPDNSAWQLGGGVKSVREYYALPVLEPAALSVGLSKPLPLNGYIKANLKKPVAFSFRTEKPVKTITVVMGEDKKQTRPEEVNFADNGGLLSFNFQFKKDDTYPFYIIADGKPILAYMVEVSE